MDGAWLRRLRWRRRGAWMWPAFIALTVGDALIGHALPPDGDGWDAVGAGIAMGAANLFAIVVLAAPVTLGLRRARPDLPKVVARDYSGTAAMCLITAVLLIAGLVNRASVQSDQNAMSDAIKRAQAYVGDRAPDRFKRDLGNVNTYVIQAGSVYRVCVPSVDGSRFYCVVVNVDKPFSRSVTFAGSESNQLLSQGFN
jgi:hypothetical protein